VVSEVYSQLLKLSPIHFVGVLGSGMRPLAELCSGLGATVSGSDKNLGALELKSSSNIGFCSAFDELSRIFSAKTVVYSSAISKDHPGLLAAKSRGILVLHRSELLALVSKYYDLIAVAGSHGKTTTTCLLSHFLTEAKLDPSFVAGASFKTSAGELPSFRVGSSNTFVIEADESDGSFLRYSPHLSIVTNIGLDHLDFYKDVADIEASFAKFVSNTKPNGIVVTQESCKQILQESLPPSVALTTFGFDKLCDLSIGAIKKSNHSTTVSLRWRGDEFRIKTSLIGKFNCLNLAAASAAFLQLGGSREALMEACSSFSSVRRRQDLVFRRGNSFVFDDYAHNPDKVRECVLAFREWFLDANLIVVFQPHRFSRFKSLFNEFQSSFKEADFLITTPIYGAGEPFDDSIDLDKFSFGVSRQSGCETLISGSLESTADMVISKLSTIKTNVVLVVGAGDINKLTGILEKRL
jgi:UDP-N-acetylmuramate--alanine ligase